MSKSKVKINKKKMVCSISLVLLIIVFITVCLVLKLNSKKNYKTIDLPFTSGVDKLEKFDGKGYYKIGWLQIQGTDIDLPIMESNYLDVEETSPSFAWRSSDYISGENREVLIGHNILNVSSTPMLPNEDLTDFEELLAFTYYDFAKDNLYLQYTKDGKDEIYLIYAAGFYSYTENTVESTESKKELDKYIKTAKEKSIYDYDVDVDSSDDLLELDTCTRYFGLNEKQQFIIQARKLRKNEKIVKYGVEKNKNYKMLDKKEEKM